MIIATDGQAPSDGPTWMFTTDVSADITRDDKVNLEDYTVLAKNFNATDCNDLNDWCDKADIDKSGVVDINDLFIMVEHWLAQGATAQATFVAPYNGSSPTIDGVLSESEWGSSYTVTMDRVDGGGQHDIELYFQNDETYLFIGVDSQWGSGGDVVWDWYIDGDYSRTINGNLSQPYTDVNICQPSPTGWSGYKAYRTLPDMSGVRVGYDSGASSASSGSANVSYEFRIPLADLGVIPGDSIGLIVTHGYDGNSEHLYELSSSVSRTTPENWATLQIVPEPDLLQNMEFETDLAGWTSGTNYPLETWDVRWSEDHGGSAKMYISGAPAQASISQETQTVIMPGDQLTVNVYHSNMGNFSGWYLKINPGPSQVLLYGADGPEGSYSITWTADQQYDPGTLISVCCSVWPGSSTTWVKSITYNPVSESSSRD